MRARAVIGANFGDEGKGLVTDYLCYTQGAGMVVRFNGGAQAGHTVVTPAGTRHVFSHFGSGTFCGVPTFLSQFFVCNPLLFLDERVDLDALGILPTVYAHPDCLVTTFADMIINQTLEEARGTDRHGSVGVGFNETIVRSLQPDLKITMRDLWSRSSLEDRLWKICGDYALSRCGKQIERPEAMIGTFIKHCRRFADAVFPLDIRQCRDPVFEGAQGLMLDQNNMGYYPHLTRSNTGIKNVRLLCALGGITKIEPYYVSRTYLTRHGAGPLPGEDAKMAYPDDTNVEHDFQGRLRFAPLDVEDLYKRCDADSGGYYRLVLTHCDQRSADCISDLTFHGPTRNDARGIACQNR